MNLSVSNIGWTAENDVKVYEILKELGFNGVEIAPTRIIPESPYDNNDKAKAWAKDLKDNYGFVVPSMQSIWYGRQEALFGSAEERKALVDYTKKAIDFAEAIGCKNLVFGCPRNRSIPEGADEQIAIDFFKELGDYAYNHNTVVGMEANPPIYNTNYINDTAAAFELIEKVNSKGFMLNLDLGTMIHNEETVESLRDHAELINHVHISEPGLKKIQSRDLHKDLKEMLTEIGYNKFVSIEVATQDNIDDLREMMEYVRGIF